MNLWHGKNQLSARKPNVTIRQGKHDSRGRALAAELMPYSTIFAGRCKVCNEFIAKGQDVVKGRNGGMVHPYCKGRSEHAFKKLTLSKTGNIDGFSKRSRTKRKPTLLSFDSGVQVARVDIEEDFGLIVGRAECPQCWAERGKCCEGAGNRWIHQGRVGLYMDRSGKAPT